MKRWTFFLVVMVCLFGFGLMLTSCDNGTTNGSGVVGTWVGQYQVEGLTILFTYELRPNFTFICISFVPTIGTTIEASGTYSVTGDTITFRFGSGGTDTGTISGNTIVIVSDEFVLILTRQ